MMAEIDEHAKKGKGGKNNILTHSAGISSFGNIGLDYPTFLFWHVHQFQPSLYSCILDAKSMNILVLISTHKYFTYGACGSRGHISTRVSTCATSMFAKKKFYLQV